MNKEINNNGFNPGNEAEFLGRLPSEIRRKNLGEELRTQLAEDFGLLEFTKRYKYNQEGRIIDPDSDEEIVELIDRGRERVGANEEVESMRKIEEGLKNNSEMAWIHFSPENQKIGYTNNCLDFWRVVDNKVIVNRMVVKQNFNEINEIRSFLSGEEEVKNELEILKSPITVNLKLTEIFSLFDLYKLDNSSKLDLIKRTVDRYLTEFNDEFGNELTNNKDLIFRLYSACYSFLKINKEEENIIDRNELGRFMYGRMRSMTTEKSFGCSGSTNVGNFAEGYGYFIVDGKVSFGKIPEGFKECKDCGCYYSGDKCPFC